MSRRLLTHPTAYKASQYLQGLLTRGAIFPQSDPQLDQIYSSSSVSTPSNSQAAATPETHESESPDANAMLLSTSDVPKIQHTFKLPKSFAADVYRALAQTNLRINKHREEAAALEKKS